MNQLNCSLLISNLKEFDILAGDKELNQFMRYYELLIEWNSFMNLTAITEWEEVVNKHFVDSLSVIKALPDMKNKNYTLIDVGTGAGFPGIPLKIVFPELKITLLDSLNKRVQFLNEVINQLELKDINAVHGRAEDFAKPGYGREAYDICVSRAVANLSTLCEYCLPFVKISGKFISYKSEKIQEELKESGEAIRVLGGSFDKQIPFGLPSTDMFRNLIVINKIKPTPGKFPRKAGTASKEPINKK